MQFGTDSHRVKYREDDSVLKVIGGFGGLGGTRTTGAVRRRYQGHDRVLIITDEQAAYGPNGDPARQVPQDVPVYTWNLAGHRVGHAPLGGSGRHTFGGLSDAAFRVVPLLERGRDADWPWA